jgi:hypothetical protein
MLITETRVAVFLSGFAAGKASRLAQRYSGWLARQDGNAALRHTVHSPYRCILHVQSATPFHGASKCEVIKAHKLSAASFTLSSADSLVQTYRRFGQKLPPR